MESVRDMQLAIQLEEKMEIKLGGCEILFYKNARQKNLDNFECLEAFKASRHWCEKLAECFVFEKSVCDIFYVNLGELTRFLRHDTPLVFSCFGWRGVRISARNPYPLEK